jgi:hypothetical protein
VPVKLPGFLSTTAPEATPAQTTPAEIAAVVGAVAGVVSAPSGGPAQPVPPVVEYSGGPIEFEMVVPPSGNLQVAGKQFWLGPTRAGVRVTLWADTDVIHLLIAGVRVKSLRSHLSAADLTRLVAHGGRPAGPPPVPSLPFTGTVEIDRTVSNTGVVSIGQHIVLAAEILRGRRVGVRIEQHTLGFFDPDTRQVLRTRPNPLTAAEVTRLRGARPAGPAPQPAHERVTVQRRASNSGVIMVVGQKVALGRVHARKTLTVHVGDTELVIDCDGGPRTIRRTTTQPVRSIKAHRPRKVDPET